MFDMRMFRLLRSPSGRVDVLVIGAVVLVSVAVDLIAASLVGIGMAILLFIRDQVRGSVIRRKIYLSQMSSKTRRPARQREVLDTYGSSGVFCELQGNLFFGTTDQLHTQLGPDLSTKLYVLLDMRRVDSMDYTAAHIFEQMHAHLAERGGQLLFSGMPSGLLDQRNFELYLQELGVIRHGGGVMISETMDSALEWIEERILERHGVVSPGEERPIDVGDFELFREFDGQTIERLRQCMDGRSCGANETVCALGEAGDELYLVRKGSVRIMLPLEGGKKHHLSTIGAGDFFGEITFLDRGRRSALVEAKNDVELFILSRGKFNELSLQNPELGVKIFARLALEIGKRLRYADAELAVLLDR
jgi:SulP family sulfate permease